VHDGDDKVTVTGPQDWSIDGDGGDDTLISGNQSRDYLNGGPGGDVLRGGPQMDQLVVGARNDAAGNDRAITRTARLR